MVQSKKFIQINNNHNKSNCLSKNMVAVFVREYHVWWFMRMASGYSALFLRGTTA